MQWNKTKYPGIRYREHESRKNGIQKDRYFVIRYQYNGKRREEGLGWASEGWTAEKASLELAHLKKAHTTGQGAASLAEKRAIEKKRREDAKAEQTRLEQENVTFQKFFDDTYLPAAQTSKKQRSHETEEQLFRLWLSPQIGEIPIKSLSAFHVEKIKKAMVAGKKSARTIQYAFATMRQIWNAARMHGIAAGDCPTRNVKAPKIDNRRLRFLSQDEATALLAGLKAKSQQLHDIALLSLHTGMRAGEIFSLQWGHVDLARGFINIIDTKSGRNRAAYMTAEVKKNLQGLYGEEQEQGALVFTSRSGERIKEISSAFDKVVKELGFNAGVKDRRQKLVFHTLRHSFASWLVENGTDLYTVKELMGHGSIAMTERYSHLGENTLQGAVKNLEATIKQKRIEAEKKKEEAKQSLLAGA